MITENEVVRGLTLHLEKEGYEILQSLTTNQTGIDIIAEKKNEKLFIEAKGETSSKIGSNRFGKPFTKNQVKTHISVAIFATMKILSNKTDEKVRAGIALPDNKDHKDVIASIRNSLNRLNVDIYWVKKDQAKKIMVEVDNCN